MTTQTPPTDANPQGGPAATPTLPQHGTWSGRFAEPMTERMRRFNASVGFDQRLATVDIAGSLAHARMLAGAGILSKADLDAIERGLATISGEIARGEFAWKLEDEDVHFSVEKRLTELVGDAGKRLHTARSRNDQVATDVRLWLRGAIDGLSVQLAALRRALLDLAERHADTIMPGFTHLQVAQPVTFGHYLMAYDAMFARDLERFADCRRRVNRLPLGSAALAGTSFPIDRERVARELGFEGLAPNSIDAVSDRDFAIEFEAAAALVAVHLSRFAEELVLWSTPRFGFVTLSDRFCTGSSIMPQKKNPDVPELVRGKSARVIGALTTLLVLMKGAAARLQQGQPGGQGAAVRHRRHAVGHARDHDRPGRDGIDGERGTDARSGKRGLRDGDRPRRLPGAQGPAVSRRPRGRGARGARSRVAALRSFAVAACPTCARSRR